MIIVLLLFFQSICLYCQRLVLHIHDRWINPENVRLLKEAAETSAITGKNILSNCPRQQANRNKKRAPTSATELGAESCRFCANTPQGYCRHHFHLQERELQQQQQPKCFWNNIVVGDKSLEQRQLRKSNRELKRNLKNRLSAQRPQPHPQQQINNCFSTYFPKTNIVSTCSNHAINEDLGYYTESNSSLNCSQSAAILCPSSSFPSDCSFKDTTTLDVQLTELPTDSTIPDNISLMSTT